MPNKKDQVDKVCEHEYAVVQPGLIEKKGDGVVVGDFEHGSMYCRGCQQELPIEDIGAYDDSRISVAIPEELVD